LNKYLEIKDLTDKRNMKNYRMNMIVFFDLIFLLKIIESSNLMLNNAYLFDKNDIFNFEQDSQEWEKNEKSYVQSPLQK